MTSHKRGSRRHLAPWARRAIGLARVDDHWHTEVARRHGHNTVSIVPHDQPPQATGEHPDNTVVISAMPPRKTIVTWVKAPFGSLKKARDVAPTLLDLALPFPLESCSWSIVAHRQTAPDETELLTVTARHEDIINHLTTLETEGIDPHIVTDEGLTLWAQSMLDCPPEEAESHRIVLYVTATHGSLVPGNDGLPSGSYTISPDDMTQMGRLLRSSFGPDWEDHLETRGAVRMILYGPNAEHVATRLRQEWKQAGDAVIWVAPDAQRGLARAMAIQALSAGAWHCNLRQGELTHKQLRSRSRRKLGIAASLLLCSSVLVIGASLLARHVADARWQALETTFRDTVDRVAGYPVTAGGRDAVDMATLEADSRIRQMVDFQRMLQPSSLDQLQHIVQAATGRGRITRLSLDDESITAALLVPTAPELDEIQQRLASLGVTFELTDPPRAASDGKLQATLVSNTKEAH